MNAKTFTTILLFASVQTGMSQITTKDLAERMNILTTAVPFLTIQPYPAINGTITSVPDGTPGPGLYGNQALLALDTFRFQASADYVPWGRQLMPDINLYSTGASYRISNKHSVGMNFRYFSLGTQTTVFGGVSHTYRPREFAGTVFYTYNTDKYTGLGIGLRYIQSDLTGKDSIGFISARGRSLAADLGFAKQIPGRDGATDHFVGISLRNVGSKVKYSEFSMADFIPTSLHAGYGFRWNADKDQSLTFSYEFSKLLVPTPPVYYSDSTDGNGDPVIQAGFDPNVGVFRGMIQSFYDAPGGYREEFHEITHSLGIVYKYRFLSAGAGYFYQSPNKGNRQYLTTGLSGNFSMSKKGSARCRASLSYMVPVHKTPYLYSNFQAGLSFTI